MGRPKGSKNKVKAGSKKKTGTKKVAAKKSTGRGRGRPKGSKNKKKNTKQPIVQEVDISNVVSYKFLGYCPKCYAMISTGDLVSKLIFNCIKCDKRDRTSKLKDKLKGAKDKPQTKKEYLSRTIHAEHHDMPAMIETPIDIKVETL